ncbi:hypothetical protein VIGAN_04291600 [Vigna angularis var. angularis]|uniref:Uncharacterized protein n=1 Tax=Vigna angularis var. angularis TaxID=157739 RepID=A0A0S3RXT5_PHAAN|nr:hypothetical protein VIGAN_04291600 [Vigna angularis var. angularis]
MLVETSTDEIPDDETSANLPSFNPFLPTYNENLKEEKTIDFGLDLDSSSYETEQLADNIFKIWDLDIPSEEDGRKREKGRKSPSSLSPPLALPPSPGSRLPWLSPPAPRSRLPPLALALASRPGSRLLPLALASRPSLSPPFALASLPSLSPPKSLASASPLDEQPVVSRRC